MTIREYLAYLSEDWNGKDNRECLSTLCNALSPVSRKTLAEFQIEWDGTKPYEEFVAAQNDEIKKCIEMEISSIGKDVRDIMGLVPLTLDTDLGGVSIASEPAVEGTQGEGEPKVPTQPGLDSCLAEPGPAGLEPEEQAAEVVADASRSPGEPENRPVPDRFH